MTNNPIIQALADDGLLRIVDDSPGWAPRFLAIEAINDGRHLWATTDPNAEGRLAWGVVEADGTVECYGDSVRPTDLDVYGRHLAPQAYEEAMLTDDGFTDWYENESGWI